MSKTVTVHARIEPEIKQSAEAVFAQVGLSPSEAIALFYRNVSLHQGIPFELKIPNKLTRQTMRDAEQGKNLIYGTLEELKKEFE